MKIDRINTRIVRIPLKDALVTGNIRIESIWFLLVDLDTDDGVTGSAYIWGFNKAAARSLEAVIEHLSDSALGEDPSATARLWGKMWRATIQQGHAGLAIMALSAIDAAAWDLLGKVTGRPVADLLGRKLDAVPAYGSGLWITDDMDKLARDAQDFLDQGFRAMKMRVGRPKIAADVAAVRVVREAIGPDIGLMADFSSALTPIYATKLAHALEPYDLLWIEDPIADEGVEDHAVIARDVKTPICFGEKVYSPQGLKQVIDARAGDVLMADMQRAGGVTGWSADRGDGRGRAAADLVAHPAGDQRAPDRIGADRLLSGTPDVGRDAVQRADGSRQRDGHSAAASGIWVDVERGHDQEHAGRVTVVPQVRQPIELATGRH